MAMMSGTYFCACCLPESLLPSGVVEVREPSVVVELR